MISLRKINKDKLKKKNMIQISQLTCGEWWAVDFTEYIEVKGIGFYLHSNAESCIIALIVIIIMIIVVTEVTDYTSLRRHRARRFAANWFAREALTTNQHINNKRGSRRCGFLAPCAQEWQAGRGPKTVTGKSWPSCTAFSRRHKTFGLSRLN